MAARNKPYDQFGPFILFKKLDSDSLGELWRAGRIQDGALGQTVAVRRFTGGSREKLAAAAAAAQPLVAQLSGASFVRGQESGVIDGVPYVAYDYANGRSLRHIIDRARGTNGSTPNPLPIDQAIVIAEKVALSLSTMNDLRDGSGERLVHGGLIPQFIWISDDGEIRVAGQQLGAGLIASLSDAKVAADIGRYFSLEYRTSGAPSKGSEVYAMGAILFLLVTGQEPPDANTASAFMSAVRAAKTMTGASIPDDIRVIVDKSLNLDPGMRYPSIAEMKQAISALAHGGKYSASTFNLAFYLSNLLKKEMEGEAIDRDKESKVNVAPYLEAPRPQNAAPVAPSVPAAPMFAGVEEPKSTSKAPLIAVAAVVLAAAGAGGWFMMRKTAAQPVKANTPIAAAATMAPPKPQIISEPIAVTTATTATTGSADPDAQKKAFEEAVKLRMQEEMMKLQSQFTQQLKQEKSTHAPVESTPPAPAPQQVAEERSVSAAQLDSQRREEAAPVQPQQTAPAPQQAVAPAQSAPAPVQTQPSAAAPQVASVREGDVVDVLQLDVRPRMTRMPRPQYPPIAARQKIAADIVVTALVSENGDVLDVRVLKGLGSKGYGLDDAAIRAMRSVKFTPPMKGGTRVRTWWPQTISFRPD